MTLTMGEDQLDTLNRSFFCRKLRKFLVQRSRHEVMRTHLRDRETLYLLWGGFWGKVKGFSEKKAGIALAYTLACRCEGLRPEEMFAQVMLESDPAYCMKCFLSDHGYVRFAEFSRAPLTTR